MHPLPAMASPTAPIIQFIIYRADPLMSPWDKCPWKAETIIIKTGPAYPKPKDITRRIIPALIIMGRLPNFSIFFSDSRLTQSLNLFIGMLKLYHRDANNAKSVTEPCPRIYVHSGGKKILARFDIYFDPSEGNLHAG